MGREVVTVRLGDAERRGVAELAGIIAGTQSDAMREALPVGEVVEAFKVTARGRTYRRWLADVLAEALRSEMQNDRQCPVDVDRIPRTLPGVWGFYSAWALKRADKELRLG